MGEVMRGREQRTKAQKEQNIPKERLYENTEAVKLGL